MPEKFRQTPALILYNPKSAEGKQRIPMSLLALAAVLEGKYEYEIIDGNFEEDPCGRIRALMGSGRAIQFLAVTVMPGPQLTRAVPDCQRIKRKFPHLKIIWGGYFPSLFAETALSSDFVDFVIRGQGEITLLELLRVYQGAMALAEIDGLSYKEQGMIRHNQERQPTDPNLFPRYPYERFEVDKYLARTFLGTRTISYHSSFGCPFKCNFCGVTKVFQGRWLGETADRLINTIRFLYQKYHIDAVEFNDNNFFVSESRVAEFSEGISDLNLSWWAEGRIDTLLNYSTDTWRKIKESGCRMIFLGAESGSDETIRRMNKEGLSTRHTLALAKRCRDFEIVPQYSFILGNPIDTERDIRESIDFIYRLKRVNPDCEVVLYLYAPVPLPGTEMYELATAQGFGFPRTLDEWVNGKWRDFACWRNTHTPWLKSHHVRLIRNFELVLNSYYPTVSDLNLTQRRRRFLRALSLWRYRLRFFSFPLELQTILNCFSYRRPEEEGF